MMNPLHCVLHKEAGAHISIFNQYIVIGKSHIRSPRSTKTGYTIGKVSFYSDDFYSLKSHHALASPGLMCPD